MIPMLDQQVRSAAQRNEKEGKGKGKSAADKRANVVMSVNGTKHRPRVAVRVGKVTRLSSNNKDETAWYMARNE